MNQPYNPFGNYGYYNPYQQQMMNNQMFNQQQQFPQQTQQISTLNGEFVDSLDVVKAKNVDMSGNLTIYPRSDLSEIYTKRLMADGTSQILTYKMTVPEQQTKTEQANNMEILATMFNQMKADIIGEIQNILPKQTQNSGVKR